MSAPELVQAGNQLHVLIEAAQVILIEYLTKRLNQAEALDQLIGLFDGPRQREAEQAWYAARAKAEDR